jgi:glycosyltransferase involved in cell wall biosynthesis
VRILIHALALKKAGGSSRHLEELLGALSDLKADNYYVVCLDSRYANGYRGPMPNGKLVPINIQSVIQRAFWDQIGLNRLAKREKCDVILALLTFGGLRPAVPQISFQRTPVYFCDYYLSTLTRMERWRTLFRRLWLKQVMKASVLNITPTKAMRDAILQVYPELGQERFHVLPHPFDKLRLLNALNVQGPTRAHGRPSKLRVLYVSQLINYKGFELIPKVARELLDCGISLHWRFTGAREDWPSGFDAVLQEAKRLRVEHQLEPLGRLPLEMTYQLYTEADVFFFPSVCESFGFPLVEAMGAGLPIVAADTEVNREICGAAALYFKPGDVGGAAAQIRGAIQPELASLLKTQAKRQFAQVAWTPRRYAREILRCARETVHRGSSASHFVYNEGETHAPSGR